MAGKTPPLMRNIQKNIFAHNFSSIRERNIHSSAMRLSVLSDFYLFFKSRNILIEMVEDAPRKESNNRKLAVIFLGKISIIENFTRLWNGTRNLPEKGLEGFQGVNDIESKIFFLCLQLNEDDSGHENMYLWRTRRKIHTKLDLCWIIGDQIQKNTIGDGGSTAF